MTGDHNSPFSTKTLESSESLWNFKISFWEKKKVCWPFAYFLRMVVLNMSINFLTLLPGRSILSFLFLPLNLCGPLWLHQQTKYGRNDTTWLSSQGGKKKQTWRLCQFFLGHSLLSPELPEYRRTLLTVPYPNFQPTKSLSISACFIPVHFGVICYMAWDNGKRIKEISLRHLLESFCS